MTETMLCPRRAEGGAAVHMLPENDEWIGGEKSWTEFSLSWKPRTCSYCGSLHPEDTLKLVREGWEDEPTTKHYKGYLHPPGWRQTHDGLLKKMQKGADPVTAVEQRPSIAEPKPCAKFCAQHFT